jgi:LPXTG-motif cell wall-anchored protein
MWIPIRHRLWAVLALIGVIVVSLGLMPISASATDEIPPEEVPVPEVIPPEVPEPDVTIPEVVPPAAPAPEVIVPDIPEPEISVAPVTETQNPCAETNNCEPPCPETNNDCEPEDPTPPDPPAADGCEAQHFSLTGNGSWQANTSQEPHINNPNVTWLDQVGSGLHYTSAGGSGNFDWFFFYEGNPDECEEPVGTLDVLKIVAGEGTPDEGAEFVIDVTCDSDGFDTTLTFDEEGNLVSGDAPITDIPEGTNCIVSETDDGGADDVELDPLDGQVEIDGNETVTVTVTNTFDEDGCEPNCPVPTAFAFSDPTPPTCEDVGNFVQQVFPGVSIVVDPAFDGPGTYTVTATLDDPNAVWADIGGNEPRSREITVEDALGFQSEDPNAPCYLEPPCADDCEPPPTTVIPPPTTPEPPDTVPTCQDDPSQVGCADALPRTGSDVNWLITLAAILLLGGTSFMVIRRQFAVNKVNKQ